MASAASAFVLAASAAAFFVLVMVIVVVAVGASIHQLAAKICLYGCIRVAGSAGHHFHAGCCQGILCALSQTAADQHVDGLVCQKACQGLMA